MWKSVDQFYVLSVKDSPRVHSISKQLDYFKIPKEKLTWNIVPRLNYNNEALSSQVENHILAYRDAKNKGYKNIIVFEDDVLIWGNKNEIEEQIFIMNEKTEYFLKNYKEYDILYFGLFPYYIDINSYDNGIVKTYGQLMHCYLINETLFSMFTDINIKLNRLIGAPHNNQISHLDYWIYCLSTFRKKSYSLYPMIVFQDNVPHFKNFKYGKYILKTVCQIYEFLLFNKYELIIFLIILCSCYLY